MTRLSRVAASHLLLAVFGCMPLSRGQTDTTLRVMSYNIRSGNGNLEGTAAAIRAVSPDIVALQEVDVHWAERSDFADQATSLGQRLGMAVRFANIYRIQSAADSLPREFGVALLSHYPIIRWSNDSLTRLSTQEPNPTPRRMPGLLDATVDVGGTTIRVLNTHLDYRADPAVRHTQLSEMLDYIAGSPMPTIVCGDMNATPDAAELRPLLASLHDTWSGMGDPGYTYPSDRPAKRIDYVLVTRHFRVSAARVSETLASDHRPVVADLVLVARSER